jgi:ABC-2 type transport system ATP-binding protein
MLVITEHLTKRYGGFAALDGCSVGVRAGEVFGLLGPNGAGKTTLLRLLLGYLAPSSGTARIAGFDCVSQSLEVRARTAYLPGEARLFRRMTGHAVLDFFSGLRRECSRAASGRVAERLELDCSRQVSRMSTGMRQKLALAVVLAIDAALVILDEPTANLDPTARAEVLRLVREARDAGRTVIFSSHVLSEVEETCDRVAILRKGRLVHEQSIEQMRRSHRITARLTGDLGDLPADLGRHVTVAHGDDGLVTMESGEPLTTLLGWLARLPLAEIRIEPIGLGGIYEHYV